ncbi:hypothetical protein SARC_16938, partial [Sphaeroforma arctica JP610]
QLSRSSGLRAGPLRNFSGTRLALSNVIEIGGEKYESDSQTNAKRTILDKLGRNLLHLV